MGLKTKVLQKGKVTIPLEIRERLGLVEGDEVTFEFESGKIILVPPRAVEDPTRALVGLAEGVVVKEPVKGELRKATAELLERKLKRGTS